MPPAPHSLSQARARLIVALCLALLLAASLIQVVWLISGDLEGMTILAGGVFDLAVLSIALLARRAHDRLAAGLLTGLLFVLTALDVAAFGLGSPVVAGFFLPVVLAACALGLWSGLLVAGLSGAALWAIGLAQSAGLYAAFAPFDRSHLTFTAPVLCLLLVLTALVAGGWIRTLTRLLAAYSPVEDPG